MIKYILIAAAFLGVVACSDELPEHNRPTGEVQKITEVEPPAQTTVFSESAPSILTASVKSETVEKGVETVTNEVKKVEDEVKQVEDKVKTTIEQAEQAVNSNVKKQVCLGPNNTDCVEVVVKPKFEGTAVPK